MKGKSGAAKLKSSSAPAFMAGGKGKMFGKQSAGTKTAFVTGKADSGAGGGFAKGGKGKMFGKQSASPKKSGMTGK